MENTNNGAATNENAGLQNNAYDAKNTIGQENNFDVPATQTDDNGKKLSDRDDDEDRIDRDQEESDENEPTISDWGDYDSLNNGMPSENDPAAPGSAV